MKVKHRCQGAFHVNSTPEIRQHNATLTIDSIVICQTHAGYLRTFVHRMHPGTGDGLVTKFIR
jgi:hypothetical protein